MPTFNTHDSSDTADKGRVDTEDITEAIQAMRALRRTGRIDLSPAEALELRPGGNVVVMPLKGRQVLMVGWFGIDSIDEVSMQVDYLVDEKAFYKLNLQSQNYYFFCNIPSYVLWGISGILLAGINRETLYNLVNFLSSIT